MPEFPSRWIVALLLGGLAGCSSTETTNPTDGSFLSGTAGDPQIGLVINSTGRALTMFQLGNPGEQRHIPLGASSTITPIGMAHHGLKALVPLGEAASAALIDLATESIERFFTVPTGNLSGVAFVDDSTAVVANLVDDYVGKFTLDQPSDEITLTTAVTAAPSAIVAGDRVLYVVSSNLDENFAPLGNGVVTAIDPATMGILWTVSAGGTNSQSAALGPDGLLYVVNTGDFVADASVTIVDPSTQQALTTIPGFGPGAGTISIDGTGLAYVSGFFVGTVVWNTATRLFVRGVGNPVCARVDLTDPTSSCRGASAATVDESGTVYQTFFGDTFQNLAPEVFVFQPGSFVLQDSIAVGAGPISIGISVFGR